MSLQRELIASGSGIASTQIFRHFVTYFYVLFLFQPAAPGGIVAPALGIL
jgi:hypothetical protein